MNHEFDNTDDNLSDLLSALKAGDDVALSEEELDRTFAAALGAAHAAERDPDLRQQLDALTEPVLRRLDEEEARRQERDTRPVTTPLEPGSSDRSAAMPIVLRVVYRTHSEPVAVTREVPGRLVFSGGVVTTPTQQLTRVEDLTRRLSVPAADTVTLGGELGLALLERYEQEGTESALRAGVGWLRRMVAAAPDHPDRALWLLGLGLAYAERGRRRHRLTDYDKATTWLAALSADPVCDSAHRSQAMRHLGELCWERYWLVRHGGRIDRHRAMATVERLLISTAPLLTAPEGPDHLTDARIVAGLALLERWELGSDPADLNRAVHLLESASIDDLPPTDPRRCQSASELVDALRQQAYLAEDSASLDRAVAVAVRAIAACGPADGDAWLLLHRYTASAAHNRWRARGAFADLRLARRCWQHIEPLGLDPASNREYRGLQRDWEQAQAIRLRLRVTRCADRRRA